MIDLDNFRKQWEEDQRVKCPHCSFDVSDDGDSSALYEIGVPITYWGWIDDGIGEVECPECGKKFKVREHVRRTYDTCKVEEDFE